MQLTTAEFNAGYQKVLKVFTNEQTKAWQETNYQVKKGYSPKRGKMMFLFAYAMSTWVHDEGATNYLTEDQVIAIIAKAR